MSFKFAIDLTVPDSLLKDHDIVSVFAQKDGVVTDRFTATLEDLIKVGFLNKRNNDKTVYLKLKSLVAQKQH
jgi:hypothetical protein